MTMTKNYWTNKKVLITGGKGFLGTHLVEKLKVFKPKLIRIIDKDKYDLRNYKDCLKVSKGIDIVIHLAAKVGGIGFNREFPADLFDDNILMGTYMIKAARVNKVKKFLALGTICAYPKFTPIPFIEENLWNGYPEETNAPYGLAKKMQLVQASAYRKQYGFNVIFLLPVNLYGPGDNFNPNSSHVIPSLIKKFVEAKEKNEKEVIVWGTGRPTREFLYVEDAVEGILLACERYDKGDAVNLGSGFEISIKDLAILIKKLSGFKGRLKWDKTKPDGQPRRMLDVSMAQKEFGFSAKTTFEKGLKETIEWYIKNK
ncbi:MAG: GDP-L-fucose synthase [bacterium]|nr:GDP-L-fucose synthase [bacterium]